MQDGSKKQGVMPFGKYKGINFEDVPDSYFLYLYENCNIFGEVKEYILQNLDAIRANVKRENLRKKK